MRTRRSQPTDGALQGTASLAQPEANVEELHATLLSYLQSVFPAVFDGSRYSLLRLHEELLLNQEYFKLLFRPEHQRRGPALAASLFLTLKSCVLFLICLLDDLQSPSDDGACETYITEASCLNDGSIFVNVVAVSAKMAQRKCSYTV